MCREIDIADDDYISNKNILRQKVINVMLKSNAKLKLCVLHLKNIP